MPKPQKDDRDRITAAGDMVVYCAGFPAIYGRQPLYFEDKTFAARAGAPAAKAERFIVNSAGARRDR
jgi:type IV secretion system protein VirD4